MTTPGPSSSPSPATTPTPVPDPNIDKTAGALAGGNPGVEAPKLELRQAVITAVNLATATCSVAIGGDPTSVPNVHYLSNYKPTLNDTVWVLVNGPDILALDRDGKFGAAAFSGRAAASVTARETCASTTYTDLATFGPQVTVTVPASGSVVLNVSSYISTQMLYSGSNSADCGVFMTGANTRSPQYEEILTVNATHQQGGTSTGVQVGVSASKVSLVTGLTPGSTTFTVKYDVNPYNADFATRGIWVLPI